MKISYEKLFNINSLIKQIIKEIGHTMIPIADSQLALLWLWLWEILSLKSIFDIYINISTSTWITEPDLLIPPFKHPL